MDQSLTCHVPAHRLFHQDPTKASSNDRAERNMGIFGISSLEHSKAARRWAKETKLLHETPLLEPVWYRQTYLDLRATPVDVARHYLEHGVSEGRNPSPLFDTNFYLQQNPDVAGSGANPLVHYVLHGAKEGRLANPLFDTGWYVAQNPDVVASRLNGLVHYIAFGAYERRDPHPLFSSAWYALQQPAIDDPRVNLLMHYLENAAIEHRDPHPLFQTEVYLEQVRGAMIPGATPLAHYLYHNRETGRPNEFFDGKWYLEKNADVLDSGLHPLIHYVLHGAREGRDPSPDFSTKWYVSEYRDIDADKINPLGHYLRYGRQEGRKPKPIRAARSSIDLKAVHDSTLELRFLSFLDSSKHFVFSHTTYPSVSIILVLFNKAHFTFACLESLYSCLMDSSLSYEVIIFDNGSTDLTSQLLERCSNLVICKSERNLGFLEGVNAASEKARGEYLLLLNNDTQLPFGTLENALGIISADQEVGAVGARLILPDGTLQEAGSIIWRDGSCLGYCRGRDPNHFEANFRRDVDYGSGAFLLTRTALFERLGRFNPIYAPAYYEETDYCLRLWENGLRVVYDPSVIVFHFEFASAQTSAAATASQAANQVKFKALHEAELRRHFVADERNILFARQAGPAKFRLLFVDDRVPHAYLGSGFPRARKMIERFVALGAQITLCPTDDQFHAWDKVRETLDPTIEVAFGVTRDRLAKFIRDRRGFYDAILVSRPHNMLAMNDALEEDPSLLDGCHLIYDAEALFSDRDVALRRVRGEVVTEDERRRLVSEELTIARFASTVLCVSQNEYKHLAQLRDKQILVLGHTLEAQPCMNSFEERKDILFVGAVHADDSPNADSVIWFVDEVLPLIRQTVAGPIKFVIAGMNKSEMVRRRLSDDVVAAGPMDDLTPLYARSKIFVAPTRFAAGIPHKVHEAAAKGLPCVVTPLLAAQLGWTEGKEVLVGSSAEGFANACAKLYTDIDVWTGVRDVALQAVSRDCDPRKFAATLDAVYSGMVKSMRDKAPVSNSS